MEKDDIAILEQGLENATRAKEHHQAEMNAQIGAINTFKAMIAYAKEKLKVVPIPEAAPIPGCPPAPSPDPTSNQTPPKPKRAYVRKPKAQLAPKAE